MTQSQIAEQFYLAHRAFIKATNDYQNGKITFPEYTQATKTWYKAQED